MPLHTRAYSQSEVDDDTILSGIVCNECQTVLPSHTAKEHLDINNPIHKCPHVRDSQYSKVCDKWAKKNRVDS